MAHATADDLKDITRLLEYIRTCEGLKEKSPGCFYYKGKGILHFHTKQGRRYAHVSDGKQWHEVDLPVKISSLAQKRVFATIQKPLPCAK